MPINARRPLVAIVGRQNVGKSTLLNRLAGRRISIVEDLPGTTRDRIKIDVDGPAGAFTLMDTGGLEPDPGGTIEQQVNMQIETAVKEADLIIFLVDVKDGLLPADYEIARMLRKVEKPLVLVANKADNDQLELGAPEFARLGIGEALAISAYHGRGVNELWDAIGALIPHHDQVAEAGAQTLKIAIVGRPNVGKSMLLNALLGESRTVVSDIPGTTRDSIDTHLDFNGQDVLLIDTAGIKKRGRQGQGVDRYGVGRSLESVERADVALLVLDATEMITEQDLHIAGYIQQAYKGMVIIVNKWDLTPELDKTEVNKYLKSRLKFFSHAPAVFVSAVTGAGLKRVLPKAGEVFRERLKRITTSQVNTLVQQVVARHSPPHRESRVLKFLYATQAEVNPPTFIFFVNDASLLHFSYQRYLENQLRLSYGFEGTPLRLVFKTRSDK